MADEPKTPVFTPNDLGKEAGAVGSTFGGEPGKVVNTDTAEGGMEFPHGYKPPAKKTVEGEVEEVVEKVEGAVEEAVAEGAETAAEALEELGEWAKGDPEVEAKFDARYLKDGVLNEATLAQEFFGNKAKLSPEDIKAGKVAELNPATYAYFKDTFLADKPFVDKVIAGLEAQNAVAEQTFLKRVGGAERYSAALAWGRESYTPAQRERFNAARAKGGDDFNDAVDALMQRYATANPGQVAAAPGPVGRRQSSPERSASTQAAPAVAANRSQTWANQAAYAKDWSAALAAEKAAPTPAAKREAREKIEEMRKAGRRSGAIGRG